MVEFLSFEKGIEVNGQTIHSVCDGIAIKFLVDNVLENSGLPNSSDLISTEWYSQQSWLDAFKEIANKIGFSALYNIGRKILANAEFPPEIDSIEKGLAAIDVAYHMNHRNNGEILFDSETGTMNEGIGHYYLHEVKDEEITLKCENPYPCDFDRGIIKSMAEKFVSFPNVYHNDDLECRKKGDNFCYYHVKWKKTMKI